MMLRNLRFVERRHFFSEGKTCRWKYQPAATASFGERGPSRKIYPREDACNHDVCDL